MLASSPSASKPYSPETRVKNEENKQQSDDSSVRNVGANEADGLENLLYEQLPLSQLFSDLGGPVRFFESSPVHWCLF